MSSLEDLPLEDRIAYLEERMDQTAGRLHAALEVLGVTFGAVFDECTRSDRRRILEAVVAKCPPDASSFYRDCLVAVAGHLIEPPPPK